jgi:uncharacterized protein YpbB
MMNAKDKREYKRLQRLVKIEDTIPSFLNKELSEYAKPDQTIKSKATQRKYDDMSQEHMMRTAIAHR